MAEPNCERWLFKDEDEEGWLDWCLREGFDPATGLPPAVEPVDLPKDSDGKPLPF